MWTIAKEFKFDFGHRVWTQSLDKDLALSDQCICKHLHGHEGKVIVELTSSSNVIHETGMVTDFKHLNFFKKFLDDFLDHRFLIHVDDPLLKHGIIKLLPPKGSKLLVVNNGIELKESPKSQFKSMRSFVRNMSRILAYNHMHLPLRAIGLRLSFNKDTLSNKETELINYFESFVITSFVPTAENLSKYMYHWLENQFKEKLSYVKVNSVKFYETSKSYAEYKGW